MRTEFNLSADQSAYRQLCPLCGRRWYESIVGVCPHTGRRICMYCCRRACTQWYLTPTGQGCRERDRRREEERARRKRRREGGDK